MNWFSLFFPRLAAAREREKLLLVQLDQVTADRDEYRALYLDKCEYIARSEGKPRFSITQEQERAPIVPEVVSRGQIEARHRNAADDAFSKYLDEHPDEKAKLAN